MVTYSYRCTSGFSPQAPIFLVPFNDLVENVSSDAQLFADDTSLFTVLYEKEVAATQLNSDLEIISQWAYQWKMQFNPDKNKQAIQVIFFPEEG